MTTQKFIPEVTPLLEPQKQATDTFPWWLFSLTWITTFVLESKMDAPATWLQGGDSVSDLTQEANDGDIRRKILISILGAVGAYGVLLWKRNRLCFKSPIARLLLAYLAWVGLSAIWADDPALTIRRLVALALTLLFSVACITRMSAKMLSVFIAAIPSLNLIPGLIAELSSGNFHPFASGYRFTGTAVHPNVQAAGLSLSTIIVCWLAWQARGRMRLVLVGSSVISIFFLLLTGSRTSILAFFIAGALSALLIVIRGDRRRLKSLILAVSLAFILSGLVVVATDPGSARASLFAVLERGTDGDVGSGNGRTDLWKTCLSFAAERPFLGFGFGGFWSDSRIDFISQDQGWTIQQSHSAYIDQVLALGLPGAVLYVLLLLACFYICLLRFLRRHDGYGAWAAMLLIVAIVNGMESINLAPLFPNFAFYLVVLHIALVKDNTKQVESLPHDNPPFPSRDSQHLVQV